MKTNLNNDKQEVMEVEIEQIKNKPKPLTRPKKEKSKSHIVDNETMCECEDAMENALNLDDLVRKV